MGATKPAAPVKLICGFIYREEQIYRSASAALRRRFGPADIESAPLKFTYTDYYEREMGRDLLRRFISFQRLIRPDNLREIKIFTNALERKLSAAKPGFRDINMDPGYITEAKLVLATTKDFCHRIFLGKGIYAEVTLVYQDKGFRHREWTYPDYRTDEYHRIFAQMRQKYVTQIHRP